MYKYLNQHVIGLVTFDSGASASQAAPTSSVYLVDSVTGSVIYRASVRTRNPVVATMSENWLVWTYRVDDLEYEGESVGVTKGQHIVSVEFYEGIGAGDMTKRYVTREGYCRLHLATLEF